jgi:hypothetical protein
VTSEWVEAGWRSIVAGEYDDARVILTAIVEERDAPGLPVASLRSRSQDIGDAAECLAGLAFIEGDFEGTIKWANKAIAWSSEPRAGCGLLTAFAHHRLGERDLSLTKLEVVVDTARDAAVGCLAAGLLVQWGGRQDPDETEVGGGG